MIHASRPALLTLAISLCGRPDAGAVNTALTLKDLDRAVVIAKGTDDARLRFHAAYDVAVDDPTVQRIDVITEFRRYVLTAEEQLAQGNWVMVHGGFDSQGRKLTDLLTRWKDRVSIRTQVRFHPQGIPPDISGYETVVGNLAGAPLLSIRTPQFALSSGGRKEGAAPLVGAVIESVFEARVVGQGPVPVAVMFNTMEIKRLAVDFSRFE